MAGDLCMADEVRYTDSGTARTMFRVAVSGRREQEPSFFTVIVWRDQAEPAVGDRHAGSRQQERQRGAIRSHVA
jgi:single-stranded DNA-binding protein